MAISPKIPKLPATVLPGEAVSDEAVDVWACSDPYQSPFHQSAVLETAIGERLMRNAQRNTQQQTKKPRRRKWPLLILLLALGLLAWFAPTIVARTSLRERILPTLAPDFAGTFQIGSADLNWFSPVVLRNVKALDAQGNSLLEVQSVTSDKTLLALAVERGKPGLFKLYRPILHLSLRNDGSNLEDALAAMLTSTAPSSPLDCAVQVSEGTIEIVQGQFEQAQTAQRWHLSQLSTSIDYTSTAQRPITLKMACVIESPVGPTGQLEVDLVWQMPTKAKPEGNGQIALRCNALQLEALPMVLSRFGINIGSAGRLSANCNYTYAGLDNQTLLIDTLETQNLQITAPAWLGNDTFRLQKLATSGQIALNNRQLQVTDLSIDCDVAKLQVDGSIDWTRWSGDKPWQMVSQENFQLDGNIDLAALAAILPTTLQIRQGTEITAGTLSLSLGSSLVRDRRIWQGDLVAEKLTATNNGKPITWQQPLSATFTVTDTPQGPKIEKLICDSSFLQLSCEGTLAKGELTATGNLNRLAEELGRFVEWGNYQLAGTLETSITWQRQQQKLDVEGTLQLEKFQLALPGIRPWNEKQLSIAFTASGDADQQGFRRIDQAEITLESAGDQLRARLTRPVIPVSLSSNWPIELRVSGKAATWLPRIQPLAPLHGWDIEGSFSFSTNSICSLLRVDFDDTKLQVRQLHASYPPSLYISEDELLVEVAGWWDQSKKQLSLKTATVQSSALAFRAKEVNLQLGQGAQGQLVQNGSGSAAAPTLSGQVAYRGDLARIMKWFRDPHAPADWQLYGQLTGYAELNHKDDTTTADWEANIANLVYALPKSKPTGNGLAATPASTEAALKNIWQEKNFKLVGSGSYEHNKGVLNLKNIDAKTDWLQLTVHGKLSELSSRCQVDLKGQIQYDLNDVSQKLKPYIGSNLQIAGKETRPFTIKGPLRQSRSQNITSVSTSSPNTSPLVSQDLAATVSLGWTSAHLQGLVLGRGEIDAQLAGGNVIIQPINIPLSEGHLTTAPRIALNATPMTMTINKGPLIQKVRIAPEMCQTWLKYIAPLLADATRAEGRFSVDLENANVPLTDYTTSNIKGVMVIHSAQVSPGPLGQQLDWIARQVEALIKRQPLSAITSAGSSRWIEIPTQNVEFQMANRRIWHKQLEMKVGNVLIRTSGSVGIDQTISLMAEVPIQDSWVARDRYLTALKGQVLKIPIRGTLQHPKVDSRVLEDLSKKIISSSAASLLENELNRGLKKLFGTGN